MCTILLKTHLYLKAQIPKDVPSLLGATSHCRSHGRQLPCLVRDPGVPTVLPGSQFTNHLPQCGKPQILLVLLFRGAYREAHAGLVLPLIGSQYRPPLHPSRRHATGSLRTHRSPERRHDTASKYVRPPPHCCCVARGRNRDTHMGPLSTDGATRNPDNERRRQPHHLVSTNAVNSLLPECMKHNIASNRLHPCLRGAQPVSSYLFM